MNLGAAQSQSTRPRLIAFALALLTLLVYLPVCFHDWIFFDDPSYVLDNGIVQKGITLHGIQWAFIGWHASNWHPLTWLSHMLDYQLFGLNPGVQHAVNALFHAANSALLFVLWHRLTQKLWPSAIVAALFAWHPLHVESVAWIAERKDVLSTFFGLLALLAYVNYVNQFKVWYVWSLVFFALGLLAKPMLVTLPFVMLLLDYWPLNRFQAANVSTETSNLRVTQHDLPRRSAGTRNTLLEKTPFLLLSAASCIVTFLAQRGQAVVSLMQFPLRVRLENVIVSYARYLFKTFWPTKLSVFYPLPVYFTSSEVAIAALILVFISALVWVARKYNPCLLIGWLWFLGMLVPVIGLVQVGSQAMADRYMYLPAVGLFVGIVFGLNDLFARSRFLLNIVRASALFALGACIVLTEYQLRFWQNSETLFTHALAVTQFNGPAHMMLGVWFERQGRQSEALNEYDEAVNYDPELVVQVASGEKRSLLVHQELLRGQAAEQQHQVNDALVHYREALRLDSTLVEAYNNLGNLLDQIGKRDEALANYQSAVHLQPNSPLPHENLGTQLLELGRFDEALAEYQQASQLAPNDSRPLYLMGKAWLRRGDSAKAIAQFQAALDRDPNDIQSLTFLARVLASDEDARVRNSTQAIAFAEKATSLTMAKQPFVLGSLAMAYAEAGRFEDARQSARAALQLTETNTATFSNLQTQLRLYESNWPYREKF